MVDSVQILQAWDSLLLLLQGPLPEGQRVSAVRPRGDASSALPTQDGFRLNQEELSLEAKSSLPCCTVWLQLKAIAPCTKHLEPLSLNRCWIACFSVNENFFSRILFLLLEAQIREDTTYPCSNDGICKCPEEPESTAIPEGQRKLKGHRVWLLKSTHKEENRCACVHELERRM